ncbi:HAD-IA family hydrolase [Planomonospora sp. ID67723]|uniref:HAD family hydrolase n=1 Tax=Planomonospora sp. ID67723 TaxID=2738134 RepID=UPI0018C3FECC|nr:HAD-IA family hydrolase [Planomonospora sp. ID67723]MBG0830178.1 HAD-IA family hydrolase [Planomonospora sp. ID67723]
MSGGGRLPYDAVLCDFYDVIGYVDLTGHERRERSCGLAPGTTEKIAFTPERAVPAALGRTTAEQWTESIAAELIALVGSEERARELSRGFVEAECRIDEEVVTLLRRARTRVPVVLVSNSTLQINAVLESAGLSRSFDAVVTSAQVGAAKPDPRIYHAAAREAGAPVGRCLFVDDQAPNVAAAVELGMTGVAYRGPADLREALAPLLS